MTHDEAIYDLGEVDLGDRRPAAFPPVFATESAGNPRRERAERRPLRASRVGPQLAGSLSLFVPGLGHIAAGQTTWGVFYATCLGFCAAVSWASYEMRHWLVATLKVLEVRVEVIVIAVAALAVTAMLLHLAAISHAQRSAGGAETGEGAHPIVAGLASLLVPGWGQILVGHSKRATLFVGGVWLIGAAWLAATPIGTRALSLLGVGIPPALREDWGPAVLIAAPAVLWVIAVYDAARR